jgi:molecular chaperone HscB
MNHFERFNMPVSFTIDQVLLKKRFHELSRQFHPDHFSQESEMEQDEALEISSQVNKAYKILQNPDETIKYVLQLKGLLEEEEKYALSPDFLMEMMELNEKLMDAKMEDDELATGKIKTSIDAMQQEILEPVKPIMQEFKDGVTNEADLLKVKDYYYKKKYLKRILATMF